MTSSVFLFMIALGLPLFRGGSFFSVWTGQWSPHAGLYGIGPMISGTLWIALLATALSLPLSLGTAFVITSLGGPRLRGSLGALVRFMTGIPAVICGFVGIFLLVPLVREGLGRAGMCVLAAGSIETLLIQLKAHCTLLLVSHNQEQVRRIADRAVTLQDRRLRHIRR